MARTFEKFRPHPWHGLDAGPEPPRIVNAYVEITPFDLVKYEIDKTSGYLMVDRPQRTSALPPTLYGFVPRTYCGERVCALLQGAERGDADPLDICIVSERPISRAEVILRTRVVGGLPMLDDGEADDKIIGVLANDNVWGDVEDLADLPGAMVSRLHHYFSTYKALPGESPNVEIGAAYGRAHAESVVQAALDDYRAEFGG
jgi:inorganic pyrophosphatase